MCNATQLRCMRRCLIALSLVFAGHSVVRGIADVQTNTDVDASIQQLLQLVDTISEHHIDPPSREELFVAAVSALGDNQQQSGDDELHQQLTEAGDIAQQRLTVANAIKARVQDVDAKIDILAKAADAIGKILPSGMQLIAAKDQRVNEQLAANRYVGIGIQLSTNKKLGRPVIPKVFEGGPAYAAGAIDDDVILAVDSRDTQHVDLVEVVQWLRGPKGTDVVVELSRPDSTDVRQLTMTRGVVPIASIEEPIFTDDRSTAGVSVSRISASTVHELRKLNALLPSETSHIVFDLRATAAVELHNVVLMASALIDGEPIGKVRTREGVREHTAERGRLFRDCKITILVGPTATRPAWWLAAAIQASSSGTALADNVLEVSKETRPLYLMEAVRLSGDTAAAGGENAGVVRIATGELLRNDGRGLMTFLADIGHVEPHAAGSPAANDANPPHTDALRARNFTPLPELLPRIAQRAADRNNIAAGGG
jgi:carboxyl-terminal processing protease